MLLLCPLPPVLSSGVPVSNSGRSVRRPASQSPLCRTACPRRCTSPIRHPLLRSPPSQSHHVGPMPPASRHCTSSSPPGSWLLSMRRRAGPRILFGNRWVLPASSPFPGLIACPSVSHAGRYGWHGVPPLPGFIPPRTQGTRCSTIRAGAEVQDAATPGVPLTIGTSGPKRIS